MLQVYTATPKIRFLAPVCSRVFWLSLLLGLACIIFPIIVTLRTGGFLLTEQRGRELPYTFFSKELVLLLSDTDGAPLGIWSSLPELNAAAGQHLIFPAITEYEEDADFDGYPERLSLNISVEIPPDATLGDVTVLLGFRYALQEIVSLEMAGLVAIMERPWGSVSSLDVTGDLTFVHKGVLSTYGTRTAYNESLLAARAFASSAFSIPRLLRSYGARNESVRLANKYTTWTRPRRPQAPFTVSIDINYAEATFSFTPPLSQQLKHIWVEYLALLFPFMWVISAILAWIVKNGVLPVFVNADHIKSHTE